ncbi:NAD(P)-dependent dehydrogenase, short-chain alcohol dehydrogenase family [Sphingobium faniae]|nr:NAD(P)-dependent dehydrogenase, short-chain alcohol dehydrogenase family [Sphingobium faniae]
MDDKVLEEKQIMAMRVLVTGSASGIGRASAHALAAAGEGSSLLLVDTAQDKLAEVSEELKSKGHRVRTLACDLSSPAEIEKVAAEAETFLGGLDALISNAGVLSNAPLTELSLDSYELAFAVNTRPTWLLAKACYPLLKAAKGAIVATASISATQPTPPHGSYSASKAALVMLIKQMAFEFGPDGIRCNCVSPGTIHTGMTDSVYGDEKLRAERAANIPLRRVGSPEDVAAVIAFLASPAAAYISGVDIAVDGGISTALMPTLRKGAVPK